MGVFNPKMLDASIRDVVSSLSNDQKTDVLLYAMALLPSNPSSRTIIENAVQSCLQISSVYPRKVIQARLLRAKARFATGLRGAAHQDLQAILLIDPNHSEARALMPQAGAMSAAGELAGNVNGQPRFSPELWREIATYLPRRDLKNLLFVPHALSSVASQLLFRKLHLQFGTGRFYASNDGLSDGSAIDKWHDQRSADILTRIVSDPNYACLVRTLVVSAPQKEESVLTTFQIGMLANALPKLTSLKTFSCAMGTQTMASVLSTLEKTHPNLQDLRLVCTTDQSPPLPQLPQLISFTYIGSDLAPALKGYASDLVVTLRKISIHVSCVIPAGLISVNNLTTVDVTAIIEDTSFFTELLTNGHYLEILRIQCRLGGRCVPSKAFRNVAPLQALRSFVLNILSVPREFNDPDLFPSVANFVRQHPFLRGLGILKSHEVDRVNYDASIWGVLPTLGRLQSLSIYIPNDLALTLSTWLIPRTVTSLHMTTPPNQDTSLIAQAWPGLPPKIKLLSLTTQLTQEMQNSLLDKLQDLRLLRLQGSYHTVLRDEINMVEGESWPARRSRFYSQDWYEWLECEEPGLMSAGLSYLHT